MSLIYLFLKRVNKLNLPAISAKLKKESGKVWIFDIIRKKFVVLTPEEWVRQHFIGYLITELDYPRSLFRVESGLQFNKVSKRSDILVYDREGKPWMLVECKSPTIRLNQKAFNQVSVYNMSIGARFVAVTNGMVHYCCEANQSDSAINFLTSFPKFS
ncbi:MAG: type I restriction enzyme HsdR N-terminal domain-containing protein [Flammeovirgaceae bacterium]|nr:type I restriction enzyme HsdR N-terminal domain-containing protein [Flammeovirgaceae bacterium]